MQALLVRMLGEPPELAEVNEPSPGPGESLLSVLAAPLNPVDVSIAAGRFFGGHPALPYVPGVEAVGRVVRSAVLPAGTLVFTCLDGLGVSRPGACAELTVARDRALVPLPDGVDPAEAAGLGTAGLAAWIPLTRLAQITADDIVLVLGASGTVGGVAVQVARLLGAKRIVAAGQRPENLARLRARGADAVVNLAEARDLPAEFAAACGGSGPTVIFDPLWGQPLLAALEVAAIGARILHLGQSASHDVTIPSSVVRGKSLSIFGYTTLNVPAQEVMSAFVALMGQLQRGRVHLDVTTVALADAAVGWARQQAGPGAKLVIRPAGPSAWE
jgi:NADPH:quinone reductase-like Zn-dependent oxidoreductase